MTSPFAPDQWHEVEGFDFTDITYHRANEAPWYGSPLTGRRYLRPAAHCRRALRRTGPRSDSSDVGAVLLTGNGPVSQGWGMGVL